MPLARKLYEESLKRQEANRREMELSNSTQPTSYTPYTPYTPDPLHLEYPAWPSKPKPMSFEDPNRDPYQEPLTGSGVRLDDGKWYPLSNRLSPPGTPADPPHP